MKKTKARLRVLAGIIMLAFVLQLAAVTGMADEINLLQGAAVTASIAGATSMLPVTMMVDGDTAFASRYASIANPTQAMSVTLSLTKSYVFSSVEIYERYTVAKGKACSNNTKVEVSSDGSTWTTIASGVALNVGTADNQSIKTVITPTATAAGNIVRVTFDRTAGDYVQYEIIEIMGFGAEDTSGPVNVLPTGTVEASISPVSSVLPANKMIDEDLALLSRYASIANPDKQLTVLFTLPKIYEFSSVEIYERYTDRKSVV